MKYAACVGSAGLPHFTELNIRFLRGVFGDDLPIQVRDDRSPETPQNRAIAGQHRCSFKTNDSPVGHFQGDMQAFIDALALAEHVGADVAVKTSQRFMIIHKDVKRIVEERFAANPAVAAVFPGSPNARLIHRGHTKFAKFAMLTDVAFMRVGPGMLSAQWLKEAYEHQIHHSKSYQDQFVEVFWDAVRNSALENRVHLCPEITDHSGRHAKYFLRRYQNLSGEYLAWAERFGIPDARHKQWTTAERASLHKHYDPRPKF